MLTSHSTGSSRRSRQPRIPVVGLGNVLLTDDGVGAHAVRALRKVLPRRIVVAEVGTAVLDGLHLYEWADRIIAIDATEAGGATGTIHSFGVSDVENHGVKAALHEMGLIAVLRFLKKPRPEISILAMEPTTLDMELELSEPVQAALPKLLSAVIDLVDVEARKEV